MSAQDSIKFKRLFIEGWRQFGVVDIELHERLTVITGANGAGKSTLLNVFAQHFGYHRALLATPMRDEKTGGYTYLSGIKSFFRKFFPETDPNSQKVGELEYTNSVVSEARVPVQASLQYQITLGTQQPVQGFHVPSHRRLPNYQPVQNIPTQPLLPSQAFDTFNSEMASLFAGNNINFSSTYRIKEALLSMAIFGPGSRYVQKNDLITQAFEGFSATLKAVLPSEVGFVELSVRSPDVVLKTTSGDFLLDAASGGVSALIDLAWQIYTYSLKSKSFVVTIDEPENHLHPAMQRTLMGNLMKTFPDVQFIVATHSPFIISADRDARVYALRYSDDPESKGASPTSGKTRSVSSEYLDTFARGGSASEILRDVLGLPTTYPDWTIAEIDHVVQKYQGKAIDSILLAALRADLRALGMEHIYPDALTAIVKR